MPEFFIKDKLVLYSECDEEIVKSINWYFLNDDRTTYVHSKKGLMHRVIMKPDRHMFVDHINHNGLDNRRENLRICTKSQNMANRISMYGSSKYKGVSINNSGSWSANINKDKKRFHLGRFPSQEEAALAYNKKAIEFFGDFAFLNKVDEN